MYKKFGNFLWFCYKMFGYCVWNVVFYGDRKNERICWKVLEVRIWMNINRKFDLLMIMGLVLNLSYIGGRLCYDYVFVY